MANMGILVQEGANFPAIAGSALLWNGKQGVENRIVTLKQRIRGYMKGRKEVAVSELVENLYESPDVILKALKSLKDEGLIQET